MIIASKVLLLSQDGFQILKRKDPHGKGGDAAKIICHRFNILVHHGMT